MIDMSFLLITFFVMTIRLGLAQDQEIDLPRADQAEATHESRVEVVTVRIDQAGRVAWPGGGAGTGGLSTYLEDRRTGGADVKVVLRADARAPFTKVQRVMRSVATAGVSKLSLSALRLGEDSP
jgi:biopolymer transport protein ExbD